MRFGLEARASVDSFGGMSKSEILAELPRLSPEERAEIIDRLWHLEEAAGPTEREKTLLNEAQASYDAHPADGAPWRDVAARLRAGEVSPNF